MKKRIVTLGEILMRLSPPNHLKLSQANSFDLFYGGAEANVAASLSLFGLDVKFITSVPPNDLGDAALAMLHSYLVNPIAVKHGNRLGLYYFEHGASARPGKVIYDRIGSSFSELKVGMIDWESIFNEADWFHFSGITAALSIDLAALCEEALQVASRKGLTISADLNYRPTLWNYGKQANEIMPNLIQYCDVLLGGVEDSDKCLGITIQHPINDLESIFKQWQQKFPKLKTIASTERLDANASSNLLSAVLWNGNQLYRSKEYNITHIVDRIGAGDAFMAGIIYGLIHFHNDAQRVVEFATAASCLKHSIVGDINLSTVNEVNSLMNGANGGRVLR